MFEMTARDAFGRIGALKTEHGKLKTPTVLPVVDPRRQLVDPPEIVEMGAAGLITNAFLIYRDPNLRRRALEAGIHEMLGVDCPIATDSGGYQIYRGQDLGVRPDEIHRFEAEIGADLAVVLDVPPSDGMDRAQTERCIAESINRSRSLSSSPPDGPLWYGVVHLTGFDDLRRGEADQISQMGFDVFALGSCVGSLVEYRFDDHVDRAVDTAKRLRPDRPRHVFGVGHPMFLAMSVAFGGDLFDSAMYTLAAQDKRYLTPFGTLSLDWIREFPCSCPVCSSTDPDQMRKRGGELLLAKHNLYTTFEELRRIRQAIFDNDLWELVQARARSHPRLLGALQRALRNHGRFLESVDPFTKRSALFYSGPETRLRPEVRRARRLSKRVQQSPSFRHPLYGAIPCSVSLCYPFGQTVLPSSMEKDLESCSPGDREAVKAAIDFQFGRGCGDALEPFQMERSRRTGRVRTIRRGETILGVMRAKDFFFLPSIEGARILAGHLPYPRGRVVVDGDAVDYVSKGRSVFAKFVVDSDPAVIPAQEVFVVDPSDSLLATGTAQMNSREMESFEVGVAVRVRHSVSS